MTIAKITTGGQVSIPAAVRRRWATSRVAIDDLGDELRIRPLPDDPIAAAKGSLKTRVPFDLHEARRRARADEAAAELRKQRLLRR